MILVFCRCAQASSKVFGSTQDPNRIAKASQYGKYIVKEITLPDTKITIKLQKSILSVILIGIDTQIHANNEVLYIINILKTYF